MDLDVFVTDGLGDNSYLIASGDEAALIDPQRDAWRFVEAAERRGLRIRHVLETHVHNDYLSGALEVRRASGAEIIVPAGGGYAFPHRAVEEGGEITVGDLRLVARATPGHTPEHLSWEVHAADRELPDAVFSGGSLLVGSAGRTDLLGPELTDQLSRAQYRSVQQLALLPDSVRLLPTHGAGSFCVSTAPTGERTSTIGHERGHNPALTAPDEETFVRQLQAAFIAHPTYYRHMAPLNRAGPELLGGLPAIRDLTAEALAQHAAAGAWVIDGRGRTEFAAAHIPGSLNVELNEAFGSYVGWVVPFGESIALVLPEPVAESLEESVTQLIRIGYERIVGHLAGGIGAWQASGRQVSSYPTATMKEVYQERVAGGAERRLLDVRQPAEWRDDGSLPGARQVFVGDLPARLDDLPRDERLWAVCTSGHRAALAASLLDRAGIPAGLVSQGGSVGWVERFERVARRAETRS